LDNRRQILSSFNNFSLFSCSLDNNVTDFNQKIKRAENYILKSLGMPVSNDFHKKFSVRNPDGQFFSYLIKEYYAEEFEITDTFLETSDKSTIYLRKRVKKNFLIYRDKMTEILFPKEKDDILMKIKEFRPREIFYGKNTLL